MLAGLLFRLGGYQRGQERACLNDALIFLQAQRLGCVLRSANVRDFDLLDQLRRGGRMLLVQPAGVSSGQPNTRPGSHVASPGNVHSTISAANCSSAQGTTLAQMSAVVISGGATPRM